MFGRDTSMKKFTVYGGCISRDIFNYLDTAKYNPTLTIGQNPITTMFEKPIKIDLEDYVCGSNFEKRMLYYDANKLALDKILESDSEYFIFDVICERITVMAVKKDGCLSAVEKSWVFVDNFLEQKKTDKYKDIEKVKDIDVLGMDNSYEEKIDLFCKKIAKKFPKDKIIFLELRLVDEYLDENNNLKRFNQGDGYKLVSNFNNPEYGNSVLKRVEQRIKQNFPDIHYIPMPKYVLADAKHHFGLHPLHYADDYYEYAASAIKTIIDVKKPDLSKESVGQLCELQSKANKLKRTMCYNNSVIMNYFSGDEEKWKILNSDIWNTVEIDGVEILYPNGRKYGRIFLLLNQELEQDVEYCYDIKWKAISKERVRLMLTAEATEKSKVSLMSEQEVSGMWQRVKGEFSCKVHGLKYLMLSSTDFQGRGTMLSFDWIRIWKK